MNNNMKQKIYNACKTDAEHILEDRGLPPMWPLNIVDGMWYLSKCYVKELFFTVKKLKPTFRTLNL